MLSYTQAYSSFAVSSEGYSSFSLKRYPRQERGQILRQLSSFNIQRRVQVPLNEVHAIWKGKHGQSLGYCLPRSSDFARNQENIDNLPSEQYKLEQDPMPKPKDGHQTNMRVTILKKLSALFKFCRLQGIIFQVFKITMISLLPVETMADLSCTYFMGVLKVMAVAILMDIFVVGVNQLYDIEIDKVNKPDLPLASGDLSVATGVAITWTSCLLSFAIGLISQSWGLLCGVISCFLYGAIYSIDIPFLRWKRDPLLTTLISVFGWGIGTQIPYFIHFQNSVLRKPMVFTKTLIFSVSMMSLLVVFLILMKDIADVDGDRENGIVTFAIQLGEEKVFSLAVNMLLVGYGLAMMIGASSSFMPSKIVTVFGHFTLAFILWLRAKSTNIMNDSSEKSFYKFIWKLIYAECILIPFVR